MKIAVVKWNKHDGSSDGIIFEFERLGHSTTQFLHTQEIPAGMDVIFTFAPYNRLAPIAKRIKEMPEKERPFFIHWSTENPPNIKVPWILLIILAMIRSWIDRLEDSDKPVVKYFTNKLPVSWINQHFHRFRHLGDYYFAKRRCSLDLLADSSLTFTNFYNQHGMECIYIPRGVTQLWYDDLKIERDIDVLWMGALRSHYRRTLIEKIYRELTSSGYSMYMADNVHNPFIWGEERTRFLNRAKITLNVHWAKYVNLLPPRFVLAASNRSLVISDYAPSHCPEIIDGEHYISADPNKLTESIIYYINHERERDKVVSKAYHLATQNLRLSSSLEKIIQEMRMRGMV
jgi:hypothetical protein